MKLPSYQTVSENLQLGVATPLETFIYDNEPIDLKDAEAWRKQLEAVVNWITDAPACTCAPVDESTLPLPFDREAE